MKGKYILDIVTTPYLMPKGSSLRVDSVLKKLSKKNRVDVLTYPVGKDVEYENVQITRVSGSKESVGVSEVSLKKIILDIKILFKAISMASKNNYDVIHCEDFEAAFAGSILSIFFRKPKYVYDLHNTILDNLSISGKKGIIYKVAKVLSKFVYSRFDMVIANWMIYEKVGKKKTFLLYDESDTSVEEISLPTKNRYYAYAGNFKKYQGVEEFLKTYAKVKPSFDVVLVGEPTDDIKTLVKELNIENKVFLTGLLDIQKANYILSKAEYCLIPRISGDQPGLKMIHHIMLGMPSIASNIGCNKEVLKDKYNAFMYDNFDDLENLLRDIEDGSVIRESLNNGIRRTQEEIAKIWSYEYFTINYSTIFEDEKS